MYPLQLAQRTEPHGHRPRERWHRSPVATLDPLLGSTISRFEEQRHRRTRLRPPMRFAINGPATGSTSAGAHCPWTLSLTDEEVGDPKGGNIGSRRRAGASGTGRPRTQGDPVPFKAWCTRRLRAFQQERLRPLSAHDSSAAAIRQKWWAERGSPTYVNAKEGHEAVIHYVREAQDHADQPQPDEQREEPVVMLVNLSPRGTPRSRRNYVIAQSEKETAPRARAGRLFRKILSR